jgi:hypothetical protein
MAQQMMVLSDGRVLIPSFVDGGRIKRAPARRMSEQDIMARALWLERHGQPEEAWNFLDETLGRMH